MTLICSAVIQGSPVPKGRPRIARATGNIYTPKETVVAEKAMAWAFKAAMGSRPPVDNYDIVLAVDIWPHRRGLGDWDNFAKLTSDAANKIVYGDDRQVVTAQVRLHYDTGEDPRTEVRFATVGPPYPAKRPPTRTRS